MGRRSAVLTAALAAITLILTAACSGGGGATSPGTTGSSSGSSGGAFQPAHQGGVLHLVAQAAGGTLDPQVNYTLQYWQLYQTVYDGPSPAE
ncbi:MAG: hypothetical protein ACR2KG_10245 [Nocardioidaceae bacterium]